MMNSYLQDDGRVIVNTDEVKIICDRNTGDSNKIQQDSYKSISPQVYPVDQPINKPINNEDNLSNFYQTYINLFVNFFNMKAQQKPMLLKLDNIRSIIRPNNQFVIVDLLKSLIEYCRHEFRILLKRFLNDQTIRQNYLVRKNMQVVKIELDHIEETQESETMTDLSGEKDTRRKVQTQPEVYVGDYTVQKLSTEMIKLTPAIVVKHSAISTNINVNSKRSTLNLLKRNSTQVLRSKTDDNNSTNSSPVMIMQSRFIDMSIRRAVYERNCEFIRQVNLQRLEAKANSIYVQLLKLNAGNGGVIGRFYEQSLNRRRDKFNYDQRDLYIEGELVAKRQCLQTQIEQYQHKHTILNKASSQEQMKAHIAQFIKHTQRCQQLKEITKLHTLSRPISPWLPLRLQHAHTISQPLRLQIEQTTEPTGEVIAYHWRRYRKPFSISDFLKQNIKSEYEKTTLLTSPNGNQKRLQVEVFKKKKFKQSLFVDNRKRINELLEKNNYVSIKKDVLFPVIRGTQEGSSMKNSSNTNTIIHHNSQPNNLQNPICKNKQLRSDKNERKMLNLSTKKNFTNSGKSKQLGKELESIKKISLRQDSQRKHSQSQKLIERLTAPPQRQQSLILSKFSNKFPSPLSLTNRDSTDKIEIYEQRVLVSKYSGLKPQQPKEEKKTKSIQITAMLTGKKLPVVNMLV